MYTALTIEESHPLFFVVTNLCACALGVLPQFKWCVSIAQGEDRTGHQAYPTSNHTYRMIFWKSPNAKSQVIHLSKSLPYICDGFLLEDTFCEHFPKFLAPSSRQQDFPRKQMPKCFQSNLRDLGPFISIIGCPDLFDSFKSSAN